MRGGSSTLRVPLAVLAAYAGRARQARGQAKGWPTCARCAIYAPDGVSLFRPEVDRVELVDGGEPGQDFAVIRGFHHGREDVLRIEFPCALTCAEDMSYAWRSLTFFESELAR